MDRADKAAAILGVMTLLSSESVYVEAVLNSMVSDRATMDGCMDFLISKVRLGRSQYVVREDVKFWCRSLT